MRIYLAGPLFTQGERAWNRSLAGALREAGHVVFLPQEEIKSLAALDAEAIFQLDMRGVRQADVVVAVLDGADPDSGTCFECGVAHALGIPLVLVRTDFRAGGDGLPGQRMTTVNLMLSQAGAAIVERAAPDEDWTEVADAVLTALARLAEREAPTRLERLPPG